MELASEGGMAVVPSSSTSVGQPSTLQASGDINVGMVHSYIIKGNNNNIQNIHHNQPPPVVPEPGLKEINDETVKMLEQLAIVTTNFRDIHKDIIDKKTDKTGQSYMQEQEVQDWFGAKIDAIWITGGAGAGKTFIASSFIERSEELAQEKASEHVVVIYAILRHTEKLTTWDIVLSLIIQLVQSSDDLPAVSTTVRQFLDPHRRKKQRPSLNELIKLFKDLVKLFGDVRAVLDGLDEMLKKVRSDILKIFSDIKAHVLFTSRPSPPEEGHFKELIERRGGSVAFLDFAAQDEDLRLFIHDHLSESPSLRTLLMDNNTVDRVVEGVMDNAKGMFLHAALQVEVLSQSCFTLHEVETTLKTFPSKIEDLYSNTLQRMNDKGSLPQLVFMWLLHVEDTITIEDLRHALAVSPETFQFENSRLVSEADILAMCCGLVVVESSTRQVRFIHYTAYEILPSLLLSYTRSPHETIARTCLARLLTCGFIDWTLETLDQVEAALADNPLLEYAYFHCSHHLVPLLKDNKDLPDFVAGFVRQCKSMPYYVLDEDYLPSKEVTVTFLSPIHIASFFNIPKLVREEVLIHGIDPNLRARHPSGLGPTCLMIAARAGHDGVVESLLGLNGVAVNLVDSNGWSALLHACEVKSVQIVRRLCAIPETDVNLQNHEYESPLSLAAWLGDHATLEVLLGAPQLDINQLNGRGRTTALMQACSSASSHTVVERLLKEPGIDVNQTDSYGRSPFLLASEHGNTSSVRALLAVPGMNTHHADNEGRTALHLAAKSGYEDVVQIIVNLPGFDVNRVDNSRETPLTLAWGWKYDPSCVVEMLLGVPGVDANHANCLGDSPLLLASRHGNTSIIKALLEVPGLNTHHVNKQGRNALHLAAESGHDDTVQIFLDLPGFDVNQVDNEGETPLTLACLRYDAQDVIATLLAVPGVDANHVTSAGNSPLLQACVSGIVSTVQALLKAPGMNTHHANKEGRNALHLAAEFGHDDLVQFLLDLPGVDINQVDNEGETPLTLACDRWGGRHIAEVLLGVPGVGANHITSDGNSPLLVASRRGKTSIVKSLLKLPAVNIYHTNKQGRNALHFAAESGHSDIVQILLDLPGFDINQADDQGETPLTLACLYNQQAAAETLLGVAGVNPNHINSYGNSPLLLASAGGNISTVRALLAVPGIHAHHANKQGRNALHLAAEFGHNDVVRILLDLPGSDINQADNQGETPLTLACPRRRRDIVETLLAVPGVDANHVNSDGNSPFLQACASGGVSTFETILEVPGINPYHTNKLGQNALHRAAESGSSDIIRALLDRLGFDVNQVDDQGETPLTLACLYNQQAAAETLLGVAGVDPNHINSYGNSPLLLASAGGNISTVRALLAVPEMSIHHANKQGRNALHLAAGLGHDDIVRILLDLFALDVNTQTHDGLTPAMIAAYIGHIPMLARLLDNPATNIHLRTQTGDTILLLPLSLNLGKYHDKPPENASSLSVDTRPTTVFLLEREDIRRLAHIPNDDGWTPLMLAARFGYLDIVDRLLAIPLCAESHDAQTKDGQTALDIALDHGHQEVADRLTAFAAARAAARPSSHRRVSGRASGPSAAARPRQGWVLVDGRPKLVSL